jgi:hypothetical protein
VIHCAAKFTANLTAWWHCTLPWFVHIVQCHQIALHIQLGHWCRESILQLVAAIYCAVSSSFTATPIRNGWHCTYLVRSYRAAIRSHTCTYSLVAGAGNLSYSLLLVIYCAASSRQPQLHGTARTAGLFTSCSANRSHTRNIQLGHW